MAFLRIAVFDGADPPGVAVELWEDIMGSALRNHPACHEAQISRSGNRFAVVTKWTSAEAFREAAASKPITDVHVAISARLNLSPDATG